jgi:hypothetical protein
MTRRAAWFAHVAVILVGATGLVYGWMRYLVEPEDEFALSNHPLEPDLKAWHILLAPLLVFAVGTLWRRHVLGRLQSRAPERRRSGICLMALVFLMIASGYLVQTAEDETWRTTWVWIHGVSSCVWLALYALHQTMTRSPNGRAVSGDQVSAS